MNRYTITFLPEGTVVEAAAGDMLLDVAAAAGFSLRATCGGQGVCGKCLVRIITDGKSEEVLACQTPVEGSLTVEIPEETRLQDARVLTATDGVVTAAEVPLATRVSVQLPTEGDWRRETQAERLLEALAPYRSQFRDITIDLYALRQLPYAAREDNGRLSVVVGDFAGAGRVIDVAPRSNEKTYGAAIDLGTTTVVVGLVDMVTGNVVATQANLNAQGRHGADVISRIVYANEYPEGLAELRAAALETINRCLAAVAEKQGITPEDIVAATVAGNTTMIHLLLGIDPAGIRRDPYVPAVRALPALMAREVSFIIHPRAPVCLAPGVSSYVGGDITAGVYAADLSSTEELTLFIDLGTNGEMVVAQGDWLVCCSCSAGPAFEGSGLDHGTYAHTGAVEAFHYDATADTVTYRTIDGAPPIGICGSGYIDILAELLRAGVIDRSARLNPEFSSSRLRLDEEHREFLLIPGEEIGWDDITIGEDDIQNLLRAKAAVYAGITTLLDTLGLSSMDVSQVLLAGGFGNYLHIDHAVAIGLLPDIPRERIRFLGNTAFAGAVKALVRRDARQALRRLSRRMTNFELSSVPGYMDRYVSSLFLPHTNLSLFPSVT